MDTIDLLVFLDDAENGILLKKGDEDKIIIDSGDFFRYIGEEDIIKMDYINTNETKIKLICNNNSCPFLVEML